MIQNVRAGFGSRDTNKLSLIRDLDLVVRNKGLCLGVVFPRVPYSIGEVTAEETARLFHFGVLAKEIPTSSKVVGVASYRELVVRDDTFIRPIRAEIDVF